MYNKFIESNIVDKCFGWPSFGSSIVDVDLAWVVAAGSDGLEVLLLQLVVELFEGSVAKGRLPIADSDSGIALLDDGLLEVLDGESILPVTFNLDVTLAAHIKVLINRPVARVLFLMLGEEVSHLLGKVLMGLELFSDGGHLFLNFAEIGGVLCTQEKIPIRVLQVLSMSFQGL